MTIEDEIESKYLSIDELNTRLSNYVNYYNWGTLILVLVIFIVYGTLFINYTPPDYVYFFALILFLFGLAILIKFNPKKVKVFNSKSEKLFYYLYSAWKNRYNEKSKQYIVNSVENIETLISEYKQLLFHEGTIKILNDLVINLKSYIYGNIGIIHIDGETPSDSQEISRGWDELKNLSILIIQNASIEEIDKKSKNFNTFFDAQGEKWPKDEKEPILPKLKNYCISSYNGKVVNRFILWTVITFLGAYYLHILMNVEIKFLIPLAVIPIFAPRYIDQI